MISLTTLLLLASIGVHSRLIVRQQQHWPKNAVAVGSKTDDLRCNSWRNMDCILTGNRQPVIGVMSQLLDPITGAPGDQYIAASYIKFVESGGALAVPLLLHHNESYYYDYLRKLNGILIPGGDQNLDEGPFADTGHIIYRIALEINKNGTYFPIWGTCQGFELISIAHVGRNWLTTCNSLNASMNLVFTAFIDKSRLFGPRAPRQTLIDLYTKNITVNEHHFCLTYENFSVSRFGHDFHMLSTTLDLSGRTFVSTFEHRIYPIYGTQFHPEKTTFEPNFGYQYAHTPAAVRATQYMAWFLVNEARKNNHAFDSTQELCDDLIQNYQPMFTGKAGNYTYWQQIYIFPWLQTATNIPHPP